MRLTASRRSTTRGQALAGWRAGLSAQISAALDVGELPVTDQPAQMIQVAGGVGGEDVGQQLAVQGAAA